MGCDPFLASVLAENLELARLLVSRGADGLGKDEEHDITVLMFAVESGNVELVRLALQAGAEVNAYDWMGQTALARALEPGAEEIAGLLRAVGAREPPWPENEEEP